jgi:hypothetical protein
MDEPYMDDFDLVAMRDVPVEDYEFLARSLKLNEGMIVAEPVAFAEAVTAYRDAQAKYNRLIPMTSAKQKKMLASQWRAGNAILDLPAPNLEAVIEKLNYLWNDKLRGESNLSLRKCRIIGDLRRMIMAADG